jgi:hypothetical protein
MNNVNVQHETVIHNVWVHDSDVLKDIEVLTYWFDSAKDAADAEAELKNFCSCHFAKTFYQPLSALGPYRVVGHRVLH